MPYLDNSTRLEKVLAAVSPSVRQAFGDTDPVTIAQDIGAKYEMTFNEIDTLYSIMADALEKKPVKNLTERIRMGVDIENQSRGAEIANTLVENFFVKLEMVQPGSKPTGTVSPTAPTPSPYAPVASPYLPTSAAPSAPPSGALDDRHLRALFRISVGTNYTEDALREKFEALPAGLRQAIASIDTANAVQEIAKKYLLHVDQMGALASETGLVLLGATHPRDFTANLARRLRVPEPKALEIAKEISTQILSKVRESLRGLHQEDTPKAQNTEFKQNTNQNIQTEKKIEVPKKIEVLAAQEAKPNTPYSPQAKWSTGDERPSREEILKGVENPKEIVGPTGWRPTATKPEIRNPKSETNPKPQIQNLPKPAPILPPPPPPAQKQPEKPKSFLDTKLTEPVALPREEKRYTIDPYREPTE